MGDFFPISEEIYNTFLDIPCWKGMGINNINLIVKIIKNELNN